MIEWSLWSVLALVVAFVVLAMWRHFNLVLQHTEEASQIVCGELRDAKDKAEAERDKYKRLFELHLKKNEDFEKQRNAIWDLYRRSGLQAGNAQILLMRNLQVALRQVNNYRVKLGEPPVELDGSLQQLVQEFTEEHGNERSEMLELKQ